MDMIKFLFVGILQLCVFSSLCAQETEVVYKTVDTLSLRLYIDYPDHMKESERRPAIVFYFGGGWRAGDVSHFKPQADYFTKKGLVTVRVDYRVESKHHTSPLICLSDAKSAIRYLREHADELKISKDSIVAAGGSAGGHLAAATASIKGFDDPTDDLSVSCVPNLLVLFNPVLDNGPDGYGYDRIKNRYKEFSPYYNVKPGLPPTVIFLGTNDNLIPVATMESYRDQMIGSGNYCELYLYKGQPHGFFNYRADNPFYMETLGRMEDFLIHFNYLK